MADKELPAVSVALVDDQRIVWADGFGFEDAQHARAASAQTVYRIGSLSQLFANIAALRLAERGQLKLDAPVESYLRDFHPINPFGQKITVRELMLERSGLVREPPVGSVFDTSGRSLEATVESLNRSELIYAPGSTTKFSNAGGAALGLILQSVAGQSFAELMTKSVFDPYGMNHSSFSPNAESGHMAEGMMWSYDGATSIAPPIPPGERPAEGMESTAEDMGRFLSAAISDSEVQSYLEHSAIDGHLLLTKDGAVDGFSAVLALLPEEKLGVVVMTNLDSANAVVDHIAEYALEVALSAKAHAPLPAWPAREAIPLETVRKAEGLYRNDADWVRLTNRGGRLLLSKRGDSRLIELKVRGSYWVEDSRLAFSPVPIVFRGSGWADSTLAIGGRVYRRQEDEPPPEPDPAIKELIGEYGWSTHKLYVLEENGHLTLLTGSVDFAALEPRSGDTFALPRAGRYQGELAVFQRSADGAVSGMRVGGIFFPRLPTEKDDAVFQIVPLRPVDDLRKEALAALPPTEAGTFYPADFVEVDRLDPSIKLDIGYASSRNFLGAPVYTEARAYMQRPAAEAVVRASQALHRLGYGLLIHDSYRPWYVTKMFWDGTPDDKKIFVADPSKGSRHNRGCAVDLTLYELKTGKPVRMTGGYDEMSERSYPYYPGGASIERWRRDLLRRAMEHEGFTVNDVEWWHFDYFSYPHYAIANKTFEQLDRNTETK
jgi:D-alanyl-D-alanine dipeptidase/CubicO group peptidase (beta-lactamase class C family)